VPTSSGVERAGDWKNTVTANSSDPAINTAGPDPSCAGWRRLATAGYLEVVFIVGSG
jgi:hypothetical protein